MFLKNQRFCVEEKLKALPVTFIMQSRHGVNESLVQSKHAVNESLIQKEDFEQEFRKWAQLDNKIRTANTDIKAWRAERDTTEAKICEYMKSKGSKNVKTSDSVITLCEETTYQSLTYGYVEKCLGEIIADAEHVKHIMNYLKSKRGVTKSTGLRRTFNKTDSNNNV